MIAALVPMAFPQAPVRRPVSVLVATRRPYDGGASVGAIFNDPFLRAFFAATTGAVFYAFSDKLHIPDRLALASSLGISTATYGLTGL